MSTISVSNNDYNWRLVAAEALLENTAVTIDGAGKAAADDGTAPVGIVPQAIAAGERAPVIRGGTLSGLSGFTAGTRLQVQTDGSISTGGSGAIIAVVKSEDATTAVILTANLDDGIS